MPNLDLHPPKALPSFRRIAIGTWKTTYDPQVYGTMALRMEPALEYMKRVRAETGCRVTITHLVAKAVAGALAEMPEANAILRFNRVQERKDISVFLQVAMVDPETKRPDLSGTTIHNVDKLSLLDLVAATEKNVEKVRTHKDEHLESTRSSFQRIPAFALNFVTGLLAFLLYTLNLDLRRFGLPKDGFGSIMVTNIGSLGLETAFAPLVPFSRVPIVLAVGRIQDEAVVQDGQVVPGKVMQLCATFDHRFIDGAHAAVLSKAIRGAFADPEHAFGELKPVAELA